MTTIIQTAIDPHIQKQFHRNLRWALTGSIFYELLKFIHCILLFKLLPTATYGIIGSIFSLSYLTTYLVDLGATNSIPPFLHLAMQSKQNFKQFLITYSLLPHLPFIIIGALTTALFATQRFSQTPFWWIIFLLILFEATRSFLRLLLYTTFHAKRIVITELSLFIIYLASIWIPYFTFHPHLSPNHIFIPHVIDSIACVTIFIIFIRRYYKTLPRDTMSHFPPSFAKRLISTRLFNYLLRIGRNIFTSNFLTPLFALKFDLGSAGIFYLVSMGISAIQAIVKASINYSGNALLANIKESGQLAKKEAFSVLSQKLIIVIAPVIILVVGNITTIAHLGMQYNITMYGLSLALLYLLISFSEFFFILYEQFYIIEESAQKLCFFKLLEFVIFYGLITSSTITSPIATLIGLIIIRIISFFIIATNAFYLWKVKLNFKTNYWYLLIWIIISLVIALIINHSIY